MDIVNEKRLLAILIVVGQSNPLVPYILITNENGIEMIIEMKTGN